VLTKEQLEVRRAGIGSSEIAALAGFDPHRTAADVWLEKMGLAESGETMAQWTGNRLEAVIALLYAERTGAELVDGGGTFQHPGHAFALATPDRRAVVGPAPIVEIKNVGGFMVSRWSDELPVDKLLQVQWQLEVMGEERADLAALLGGTNFRIYRVERDPELCAQLLDLAGQFWRDHVLTREPPPCDGADAQRIAEARYPNSDGRMLTPTPEAQALLHQLRRIDRAEKKVRAMRDLVEARAKELVGEADGIEDCFTWKLDKNGRVQWAKVAKALDAPVDLIAKHTSAPTRRFLLKGDKES
jgi:putative phage-type endonuclease